MRQSPRSYRPRQRQERRLTNDQIDLLLRFGADLEQIGFQRGRAARVASSLYRRSLLFIVEDNGPDWRRYDLTETGRALIAQLRPVIAIRKESADVAA